MKEELINSLKESNNDVEPELSKIAENTKEPEEAIKLT